MLNVQKFVHTMYKYEINLGLVIKVSLTFSPEFRLLRHYTEGVFPWKRRRPLFCVQCFAFDPILKPFLSLTFQETVWLL